MAKSFSRRQFLSLASMATAGAAIVACAPKATSTPAAVEPAQEDAPQEEAPQEQAPQEQAPAAEAIELNMWGWTDLVSSEIVTKFTEKFPNIQVNLSELGDAVFGDQKFLTAVAAGTGPDVAIQNRHTFMQFAAKKLYKDVTPLMGPDGINKDDFTPVQIAETSWEDKVYGLPMFTDVRYMYWNKSIFAEVGLDPETPPTTWAELEAFADKCNIRAADGDMERLGFVPYLFGNSWMWLYGFINKAPSISEDKRTILCDDARWSEALDWMAQFYEKYVGTFELANAFSESITSAGLGDPFVAGKVAMNASGDWEVGNYLRSPELDWDCAPMPVSPNGEKSTWSCGWSVVMAPSSKNETAAWELMKWHVLPEGWHARADASIADTKRVWEREQIEGEAQYWPTQACYIPTLQMLETDYISKLGEREQKAWKLGMDALENWTHGCGSEMGLAALEYWVEMDNAVRTALSKELTAEEAMATCKQKVQDATDRAWEAVDGAG